MKTLIFLLMIPLVFACSKKEEDGVPELEGGTWAAGCAYSGSGYSTRSTSFSGGQFTQSETLYSSSTCAAALIKAEATGTYVLGGKLSDSSESQKIDETLATMTVTPLNAIAVSSYNSAALCGYTDWALNVAKDVAGKTCGSGTMSAVGDKAYDIYRIWDQDIAYQGIEKGMLNFGYSDTAHDGKTEAARPDTLNGSYNFTKQ